MPESRSPRQLALEIAAGHRGTFYSWGGDDPGGMDCSGLISDVLRSPGVIPRGERLTAQGFYDRWPERRFDAHTRSGLSLAPGLRPGMLVFWKRPDGTVRHVEMVFDILTDGTIVTIGASGGGPTVKTLADAIAANAFVQLRPLAPNWAAAVDPFGP